MLRDKEGDDGGNRRGFWFFFFYSRGTWKEVVSLSRQMEWIVP